MVRRAKNHKSDCTESNSTPLFGKLHDLRYHSCAVKDYLSNCNTDGLGSVHHWSVDCNQSGSSHLLCWLPCDIKTVWNMENYDSLVEKEYWSCGRPCSYSLSQWSNCCQRLCQWRVALPCCNEIPWVPSANHSQV